MTTYGCGFNRLAAMGADFSPNGGRRPQPDTEAGYAYHEGVKAGTCFFDIEDLLRRGVPRQHRYEQSDLRFIQTLTECGHLAPSTNSNGALQGLVAVAI